MYIIAIQQWPVRFIIMDSWMSLWNSKALRQKEQLPLPYIFHAIFFANYVSVSLESHEFERELKKKKMFFRLILKSLLALRSDPLMKIRVNHDKINLQY